MSVALGNSTVQIAWAIILSLFGIGGFIAAVYLAARLDMQRHAVINRARNISTYLDTLEGLEGLLPKDANTIALFRVAVRSIRADVDSLASPEERSDR